MDETQLPKSLIGDRLSGMSSRHILAVGTLRVRAHPSHFTSVMIIFLISVSFLTSTLNKSHWKINACHVKGDTRTGKVCRCYSTLSKHQTEGYENSQPPRCIMVLFFTPSVKQSGPVAGVTLLMLIGVDSPRSLMLFHLSPVVKRLQAVPQPPVANVSGQVMKQCSVFISVR